ncbi:Kelch-type beta propeller domain-containing protein [Strongyloides ratti]|uniref:Kelch-type beta propeller domain-containing protein n=1 Tax=Strongyloides ratti TaxID=34506 RepID=A0A090L283_STRRB|nr:Kelch-type beta propeller domain-containing protein [Strongyloides ratti]CEF63931.1 Kelch-type beta propeller domain-containing protein [Strongyloides ratti]
MELILFVYEILKSLFILINPMSLRLPYRRVNHQIRMRNNPLRNNMDNFTRLESCICVSPVKFNFKDSNENFYPRSGHSVICTGTNFFIIGGYYDYPNAGIFKEIYQYNKHANTIVKLSVKNLPKEILSNSAVNFPINAKEIEESILMFGGTGIPFSENISHELYWIRKTFDEWECVPCECNSNKPNKRYGCSMIYDYDNSSIYISGGTDGFIYYSDIWKGKIKVKYDVENKNFTVSVDWELILASGFPHENGVYKHRIILRDNIVWSFGGGNTSQVFGFKDVTTYNMLTKELIIRNDIKGELNKDGIYIYPIARKCFGHCEYNNKLIICGGQGREQIPNPTENSFRDLNDIWEFDCNEIKWTRIKAVFLHPCYFNSCDIDVEGTLITFGGVNKRRSRNNHLYKINLIPRKLVSLVLENIMLQNTSIMKNVEVLGDNYGYNYHDAAKNIIDQWK